MAKPLPEMNPALLPLLLFVAQVQFPQTDAPSPRQMVFEGMRTRPEDPWPRGRGHVILALPGSTEDFKAYHEPGGSFSPAFASFGVSLWVSDADGRVLATSDSLPLNQLQQRFIWLNPKRIPGIETLTEYYRAVWSLEAGGRWKLLIEPKVSEEKRLMLVVRSVGPAGGAIQALGWDDKRFEQKLAINDRWLISINRRLQFEVTAPAGRAHLVDARFKDMKWKGEEDWGFARFNLLPDKPVEVSIRDVDAAPEPSLRVSEVRSQLKLRLPDGDFTNCLNAQAAHLLMSLVRNETRPGDPNNYPLNWLRDGAYVLVALSRAGQTDVARQLAVPFAENDFFGGFGSEADGPGLALWSLEEVAGAERDPKFDSFLWPHVERKAGLIEEMLSATGAVRKPFLGSIVPAHRARKDLDLVCDAAEGALINGRMDWHRPILYVNAVSYRGLINAASLARRMGRTDLAEKWLARAGELRRAWNDAFAAGRFQNERNTICPLYPAFVALDRAIVSRELEKQMAATHDDSGQLKESILWTYFNLAQAHQWLFLSEPDKTWKDLRWFWSHQASPGLYTWWEGDGEENSFGRWETLARGWVRPPHVTPHYWAAAEMLLLQLDALACVDETDEPRLLIGAGVPSPWLEGSLAVEGIGTRFGRVDWKWKDHRLTVVEHGFNLPVKVGPAFPGDTVPKISH